MSEQNTKDPLSSLLSDPQALSGIAQLLSNMQSPKTGEGAPGQSMSTDGDTNAQGTAEGGTSEAAGTHGTADNARGGSFPPPDMSGLFSALSNPAMMSTLSSLAPMLSTLMAKPAASPSANEGGIGQGGFGLGGMGGGAIAAQASFPRPVYPTDRRSALLLALKPYMPEDKQSAIDTVVRVIEIMSHIK